MSKKLYKRKVWGGFVDGRLYMQMIDTGFGGWGNGGVKAPAIYTEKRRAQREFQDVRPIEIRELEK